MKINNKDSIKIGSKIKLLEEIKVKNNLPLLKNTIVVVRKIKKQTLVVETFDTEIVEIPITSKYKVIGVVKLKSLFDLDDNDNNNKDTKIVSAKTVEESDRISRTDRNRRRLASQTLSLASQLAELDDVESMCKVSCALSILAVASGFQDDQLTERLIKAANRLIGGGM